MEAVAPLRPDERPRNGSTGNEPAIEKDTVGALAVPVALGAANEPTPTESVAAGARPARVLSLDVFRGLTILLMLLVNNIALDSATPDQLKHAEWSRAVTLADFVFPWFVFAVGVSIPFSAAAFRRTGLPSWHYDVRVLRRAAILVLLGCLIASAIERRPFFSLGVLQTIGLAYAVGALLADLPTTRRLLLGAIGLLGYWAALRWMPFPGGRPGLLTEAQNLVAYVNQTFLDPIGLKGLTSVVPMSCLVLLGTVVGDHLADESAEPYRPAAWVFVLGTCFLVAAWAANASQPFNKALWTSSHVLLAAGTGTILLGICHVIIDLQGWRKWSYPLQVLGANAILAYVGPILIKVLVLQVWQVPVAPGKTSGLLDYWMATSYARFGRYNGGWFYTIAYIGVCWSVLWVLHRKRIYFRV